MITGEIKNKVDKMWEYFWTGGLTNPVDVIEQLTYLIFMKRLDQEEIKKEREERELSALFGNMDIKYIFDKEHQDIRWSRLIQLGSPKELFEKVRTEAFEFIKELDDNKESIFSQYMKNAIFKVSYA